MIELFGISISEPMTMLTDYLLAIVAFYLSWRIFQQTAGQQSRKYWALASVFIGSAAFWGGTYHGFQTVLTDGQISLCWKLVVYSVGLSTLFFSYGTALATLTPKYHKWVLYPSMAKLILCIVWANLSDDFLFVMLDYLVTLLLVVAIFTYAKLKWGAPSYYYIVAGVIVFFVGTWIQTIGFAMHEHFNHNDLLHILQTVAVVLFYRGTLLLSDRKKVSVKVV
ncbi:MAG: hypothetical protein AAGJ18_22895 [Bacteroidota bacterium]